jgi:hypothetical protein
MGHPNSEQMNYSLQEEPVSQFRHKFVIFSCLLILVLNVGCGKFFVSESTLNTITISPAAALAGVGQTINFTATGTTVGGSTSDVTSSVTWSSSATNVATITSAGVATTVATGATNITATKDSISGKATLTVTASPLQSIAISPVNPSVPRTQGTQQFTATGTLANGSTLDLTGLVKWTSSNSSVATISSTGLASLVGTGTSTISASATTPSSTITSTTTLTVN